MLLDKLDELMKARGLNKRKLAMNSGVPYTTIVSLYTKGYDNVKRNTIVKLAQYLNVTVDELMDEKDVEFDDFTYAFFAELGTLTEENKAKLLDMARYFKERQSEDE